MIRHQVTRRGFEVDFSRCAGEWLYSLGSPEEPPSSPPSFEDGGRAIFREVKEALCKHRELIYSLFGFYAATGVAGDRMVVGREGWHRFLDDCHLVDEASPSCGRERLARVLHDSKASHAAMRESRTLRFVDCLMRFEWVGALLRLAILKYFVSQKVHTPVAALYHLFQDVTASAPPEALAWLGREQFRQARLYGREVVGVIRKHRERLAAVYERYAKVRGGAWSSLHRMMLVRAFRPPLPPPQVT